MNKVIGSKQAVALILILGILIIVCSIGFAVMSLFVSQHGITSSYIGLDEVRYAEEVGLRHGLWVWRYKYEDPNYLNNGTQPYQTTLDNSVCVRVEDKDENGDSNPNRRLDEYDIEIQVIKVP
jgi:hypothetical protein